MYYFVYEPFALHAKWIQYVCFIFCLFFYCWRFGVWVVCGFINNVNVPILAQNGAYYITIEGLYVGAVAYT